MNLYEIGLFHIVWGVSKPTSDNYHQICHFSGAWYSPLYLLYSIISLKKIILCLNKCTKNIIEQ